MRSVFEDPGTGDGVIGFWHAFFFGLLMRNLSIYVPLITEHTSEERNMAECGIQDSVID